MVHAPDGGERLSWHPPRVGRVTIRRSACTRVSAIASAVLVLLGCIGPSASASAQSCPLYFTDFGSIAGPPDLVEGDLRVLWCDATSSIATSSFCNSGNALKLDSSGDDPVVLIATGNVGCTAIEVRFRYAQFAASGTMIKWGTTAATTASCTASTPNTLGALTVTGGACTDFSAVIPLNGAKGVYLRFDHGANANAVTIDDLEIRRVGCCSSGGHDCCVTGTAGCANSAIAACVCAQDPFCCDVQWDAQCVAQVGQFGCGSCGGGAACLDALSVDFGGVYTGSPICAVFPAVFESCEGTAPFLSSSLGCTGAGDMALRFANGFPYSAAVTRCVSFAGRTSPALAFTYSKQSGTLGPRIDVSLDGTAWMTAWTAPVAFAGGCVPVEIDLSALAGEAAVRFRFSSGSSTANLATIDDIALIESTAGVHACCAEGAPSCDNPVVSACTCAIDPYCCDTAWDDVCVILATIYCDAQCPDLPVCGSPTAGSCTAEHGTPACADAACCIAVCNADAFCCDTAWDATCVEEAGVLCFAPADLNRDGRVSSVDLAIVLDAWGDAGGAADVNGSGSVGADDLAAILSAWTG